ncbi:MAG: alpha/beta hydrolase [Lachnospiraceae bacterium]|nr:alpha/beta hydrolase [Lachnospiraceae bacterium]
MAAKYPEKVKSLITIGGGAYPRVDGAESYLPESLISRNDTDFIEDMKLRHYEAHKGDWKTYLRKTVFDWQSHPNLTEEEWSGIKCPAFFINGENDPFGNCAELQEKVPNAEVYEVKDGGHHPHFVGEQIDEINAMMLEFLSAIDKMEHKKAEISGIVCAGSEKTK